MATGGVAPKPFAAGIPYAAGAGQTDGKNGMMKKGGTVKKNLKRAQNGTSVGPSFSDKIKLAAKRVGRNVTNRKAVNQLQRSSKVFDSDRSKADALYNKAEATYNKAVDKNKAVNKFKREQGFAPGGDGTYFGNNKYSKPGPIISKQKKGGSTFGMLSVKAGIDKNPKPTAADRIAGAKMKMRKKK
jgi:hypothetical protein